MDGSGFRRLARAVGPRGDRDVSSFHGQAQRHLLAHAAARADYNSCFTRQTHFCRLLIQSQLSS
jgi:hypothetical protein